MRFTKMEGCGNDYIYINCFEETVVNPSELAIAMSERHFGIGADGIVLLLPSQEADFQMRMFNADGSEGEMCGNAIRCIGKYVYDRGMTEKTQVSVSTLAGIKYLDLHIENGKVDTVTVDMGAPILTAADIPVKSDKHPVLDETIAILDKEFAFTCVSMGNPHAVTYVSDTSNFDVEKYGRIAETHPIFPKKANIEFVQVVDSTHLNMRVWERGSGETLACGTGSCATLVATVLQGKCERKAEISLLGGILSVHWNEADDHVYLTGPARFSFDGIWLR